MELSEIYSLFLTSSGVSVDTRILKKNNLYFALKGDKFNGNKFVLEALEKGASYAITDESGHSKKDRIIFVEDVLVTLQNLAKYHRTQLGIPIIALTGSNGKTTSKELINSVLSKKIKTTSTIGNLNNHIGVPLTLLSMDKNTEIGIVEMGANHLREIELLSSISKPNYGYITNFGKAHLEGFGSLKKVIKGKTELYEYLKHNSGKAFVNKKDPLQVELSKGLEIINFVQDITLEKFDPFIEVNYKGTVIRTNLVGTYNFDNISVAITIGEHFNVSIKDIARALENYNPVNNRSQIIYKGKQSIIIDAYNANPSSMSVALESFSKIKENHKTVILGDMFELGNACLQEHQKIIDIAESLDFERIYLIGKNFYETKSSKAIKSKSFESFKIKFKNMKLTENHSCFLIKASRSMALERILKLFD